MDVWTLGCRSRSTRWEEFMANYSISDNGHPSGPNVAPDILV